MNAYDAIDAQLERLNTQLECGQITDLQYFELVKNIMGVLESVGTTEGATQTVLAGEQGNDGRVEAGAEAPLILRRDKC